MGAISSGLYRFSCLDIWNSNFFKLWVRHFSTQISIMDAQIWFISIVVKLTNISLTVFMVLSGRCPDMRIKTQVCFSATNLPHYQNLKTQRIKIITSMCQMTLQDSSDHFYPPTGHVRPWDFVQPWDFFPTMRSCPSMILLSLLYENCLWNPISIY